MKLTEEEEWLKSVDANINEKEICNISWSAFHASQEQSQKRMPCISSLLPLFKDNSKSPTMLRHGLDVARKSTSFLNPGQTPVMSLDEPLYAGTKQIQWQYPDEYGEDEFVLMLGGLHQEKAAWGMAGSLLKDSGWVELLTESGIYTAGKAEPFLSCSHILRTRHAHQINAAALHVLKRRSCENSGSTDTFEKWSSNCKESSQQFKFWKIVQNLELLILTLVRSFREHNFQLYVDTLKSLAPWFFALNRTHYKRWLPVHIKDMEELSTKHSQVYEAFMRGCFSAQKTNKRFSCIPLDQIHEQENVKMNA